MRNGWESWGVNSQYHSVPDWSRDWEFSYVSSVSRAGSRVLESLGSVGDQTSVLQALKVYYMLSMYLNPVPHPCLSIFWKSRRPTQQPQELLGVCPTWVMQDDSSNASGVWLQLLCSCVEEAKSCCQARYLMQKYKLCRHPLMLNFSSDRIHGPASHCSISWWHSGTHRSSECLLTHRRPFLCLLVTEFTAQFPDPWGT